MSKTNIPLENNIEIIKIKDFSGHKAAIYSLQYDAQNQVLYSAGGDGWIVRWHPFADQNDGLLIANTSSKIFALAFDTKSENIVAGDMDGHLHWISTRESKILKKSLHHIGSIMDLQFGPDNQLYSVSTDGYLCRWNINDMQPEMSVRLSGQGLRCIKYDPHGSIIYIGASDNNIYVVDATTLATIHIITQAHANSVFSLELLNDHILISGGRDAVCHIWDKLSYSRISTISAHWFTINKIIHIPELNAFATASRDKTWRLWDTRHFQLINSVNVQKGGHFNSVNTICWLADYQCILSAGDDRVIRMFGINH